MTTIKFSDNYWFFFNFDNSFVIKIDNGVFQYHQRIYFHTYNWDSKTDFEERLSLNLKIINKLNLKDITKKIKVMVYPRI